jgi:uncharacterized protein YutE (UPF0331/DUF86 family)
VKQEQLHARLDVLRQNLENLGRVPQSSFDEFASDFRNVASTLYLLQTSIQALIDVGGYVVASRALPAPRTSVEIFERLDEAGLVPAGSARRFALVVGFRNRIVHLYDRVDERRVFEILTVHRNDLAELLDVLLSVLENLEADEA